MQPPDDAALLAEYANHNAEAAFTELVGRRVGLVYSAALRQVGDPQLAEEVTQAVFLLLARRAREVSRHPALAGWLCRVAYFVSRDAMRAERRRQHREQTVRHMEPDTDTDWMQIAPLLDEAVAHLNEQDRSAVVLRFYQQKPLEEVGRMLGLNADTAQKRVSRALEKLRRYLCRRGVSSSAEIVGGAISAHSVQAAPAALAQSVAAAALAKGAAVGGSTSALIKGALKIMAWTKAKTAVVAGAVLILAAGTTTVMVRNAGHPARVKLPPTPANEALFQQESMARMNQAKQWAMAFIMFAEEHGRQLPKSFAQAKHYVPGLSESNWEIVSAGDFSRFAKPSQTILLREKESSQSPDGPFSRAYAFMDGHAELVSSPGDDFAALEKQRGFLAVAPK